MILSQFDKQKTHNNVLPICFKGDDQEEHEFCENDDLKRETADAVVKLNKTDTIHTMDFGLTFKGVSSVKTASLGYCSTLDAFDSYFILKLLVIVNLLGIISPHALTTLPVLNRLLYYNFDWIELVCVCVILGDR